MGSTHPILRPGGAGPVIVGGAVAAIALLAALRVQVSTWLGHCNTQEHSTLNAEALHEPAQTVGRR
jgi:hypothetical protein